MSLGGLLVGRGLVTLDDVDAALERQKAEGGRLGDNLIALGLLTAEQLLSVIHSTPPIPMAVSETGIPQRSLLNLLLKFMHIESCETVPELAGHMKLPHRVVQQLLDDAIQQRLLQALGSVRGGITPSIRYSLSEQGRAAAKDADALRKSFHGLVVPEHYLRKLLPAINAGRTMLLFGPPGNGKTTLATRIATLFKDVVYVPYAVEVAGQIITIFDTSMHKALVSEAEAASLLGKGGLQRDRFDERWVACSRPVAVAGGELTLEMLDLQHNPETKFYDAPLHVKALNGMLLIDDFGRQKFDPNELLNRWIVPMENQIDYLKLNTGTSFSLPFDELLVFSTNLQPSDLMDPAFLRRIPYKIKLFAPSCEEYRQLFEDIAYVYGLELADDVFDFVIERLTVSTKFGLAYYQPKFICEQVLEMCKCFNLRPQLTKELAAEALANLYFDIEEARDSEAALVA